MGLFRSWNRKPVDDQPKTDTLQPNQPDGDTSMANIPYLTPYAAGSGAITTINDLAHTHGLVTTCYPSITAAAGNYTTGTYNAGITYPIVSPQYYQAGVGTLGGQPWPAGSNLNQWGVTQQWASIDPSPMIQPVDRAEFSEEEISQAEQLMEELSA